MSYVLHIGDHAYSSWSLRGWLLLAAFDLPVETRLHHVYSAEMDAFRAELPPAATVPALEWVEGGERVVLWDSLAIAETLAERHPAAGHWPSGPAPRAAARALVAEMHSGFRALRAEAPMNTRRDRRPAPLSEAARADLARLSTLWGWARERFGGDGPFLFGARLTAADAFFAPIVWRVFAYDLAMPQADIAYLRALRDHPAMRDWAAAADADTRGIARYDAI